MSDHSITSLIEKLEGAEVGSRELDAYVLFKLDFDQSESTPPVTTSLDAALALAERVLPGWWWTTGRCGLTCHASVGPDSKFIEEPDLSKFDSGFQPNRSSCGCSPRDGEISMTAPILRATGEDSPANEGEA